jgi:hypothetical protein
MQYKMQYNFSAKIDKKAQKWRYWRKWLRLKAKCCKGFKKGERKSTIYRGWLFALESKKSQTFLQKLRRWRGWLASCDRCREVAIDSGGRGGEGVIDSGGSQGRAGQAGQARQVNTGKV